jgi:hypothetical protein
MGSSKRHRSVIALEFLENRTALSGAGGLSTAVRAIADGHSEHPGHRQAEVQVEARRQGGRDDAPGHDAGDDRLAAARSRVVIRVGMAGKAPAFYESYTGRRDPGLNARQATARVTRQGLELTGTLQGRIDTSPSGEDQESYYVFGINRGSSQAVAPFPGRPNVIFDAVVSVNVEAEGISAAVTDLTKPRGTGTTDLPAGAFRVRGNQVRVVVPLDLLTPTATLPVAQWRVNLWPRSALPPADFHTVASFVPENATFLVAARRGRG